TGAALYAEKRGNKGHAGFFNGDVYVTRNLGVGGDLVMVGGDVAEEFDLAEGVGEVSAGAVLVLDEQGTLAPCTRAYDRCVAGIVAGAGDRVPALILDRRGADQDVRKKPIVSVVGKAWCWADASSRPICVGDLLTTSENPGHGMVAEDRDLAFGAVLGKALTPLPSSTGLVLTLVGLA
ncbi:hypothetical protein ACWFR6_09450, partial [Streptomyces roseolus]